MGLQFIESLIDLSVPKKALGELYLSPSSGRCSPGVLSRGTAAPEQPRAGLGGVFVA